MANERIYLITGASSDVGMRFIERLEAKGKSCTVLGHCRSGYARLQEFSDGLQHVTLKPSICDLSDDEDTQRWLDQLVDSGFQPTDIIHLAARKFEHMRLRDFDWDSIERELKIQVNSFGQIGKRFFPKMAKEGDGRVVVMLSLYTIGAPPKYMCDYVLAKHALWGLTKSAAVEYSRKGVRINAVSPNMMETKFLDNLDPRTIETIAKNSALGRNTSLDETCAAIEYLLSDEASYLSGVNLNLSGGDRM